MMIRPDDDELTRVIEIALLTAKTYAIRDVFSATRVLNRRVAVDTLTARVMAALRPYEITREARDTDMIGKALPLFPDFDDRMQRCD
ncbi:MAG: hypothetical protein EVA34_08275 [Erythrobacter sp.]|nr:MAG: hypothetical protein EVA34_08275 [Erythrobacter sp.]